MSSPSEPPVFPQVPQPPPRSLPAPGAAGPREDPAAYPAQRLHPAAIGVWALPGVGPLVLLLVAGSLNVFLAGIIVAGALISALVRWLRFTWQVAEGALIIDQGLIERKRRVVPLERVQSVEMVRQLHHRLFGVVGLRVEAVGGNETQGRLDALDPDLAERLRAGLLRRRASGTAAGEPTAEETAAADLLARVRPSELVVAGLTGGRVGVLAALLGFASQFFAEQLTSVVEFVSDFLGAQGVQGLLVAASLFLLTVFALSIAATTLTFWNFTLTRDERNLYTRRGLLDQRTGTIPLHRVQTVRVEENLVRRWLGLAAIRVEIAGQAGESADTSGIALPIGRRDEAFEIAGRVIGHPAFGDTRLEAMPRGARDRRLVRAALATAVATAALVVWLGTPGLAGLALALPFGLAAVASYHALGHAEPEDVVLARSGLLVRTTTATPEPALQGVALTSTPLQRRRDLATLVLHIARSPRAGGSDPPLVDLPHDLARRQLARLALVAAERGRRRVDSEGRLVRPERPTDAAEIRSILTAAFGRPDEAELVDRLRADPSFDPSRSLLCERDGAVLGHALLSDVELTGGGSGPCLALAPVAVRPDVQGQGVGSRLVKSALAVAAGQGAHRVVVLGDADYYRRFGFEPARPLGVEAPFPVDDGHWLVRRLPADDGSATGTVSYPAAFEGVS